MSAKNSKTPDNAFDVVIRRTEASDAPGIESLVSPEVENVFGRINVLKIMERSLVSVSVLSADDQVLAHGDFADKPNHEVASQTEWLSWLDQYYDVPKLTAINTVFLHLFVSQPELSTSLAPELINHMFSLMPHVHYCLLLVPRGLFPDKAISSFFQELPLRSKDLKPDRVVAFIAQRSNHVPVLHVRVAKPEDNDDLTPLFNAHSEHLRTTYGEYYLAELIEAQDETMKCLVVENDKKAVGFLSVTAEVDLDGLSTAFQLEPFNHLRHLLPQNDVVTPTTEAIEENEPTFSAPPVDSNDIPELEEPIDNETIIEEQQIRRQGPSNAICIQLFCIDEAFETRSTDFLPRLFEFFPDREYVIIAVPHLTPEFGLLKQFVRVPPRTTAVIPQQLYVFSKYGLLSSFTVRPTSSDDLPALEQLAGTLELREPIMQHIKMYTQYRRHKDAGNNALQSFVAQSSGQIVGVAVIEQEKNIEYLRSHYNIEDFIYYNHHRYEEHGHIWHLAMNPAFACMTRVFLKEIMRMGHKTCLYYPIYPDSCIQRPPAHSVVCCLSEMVPVMPRRQPSYCLEKLGINAPSQAVLQNQVPFALFHSNIKMCLETKHGVNARIVVVGASETGLSTLERLIMSPHLLFHNITLLSTHGLPVAPIMMANNGINEDADQKPSGEQSLVERFMAKTAIVDDLGHHRSLYLRCAINSVPGRMTAVNRTKKYLVVNGDRQLPYDYLVLSTGQQYHIPDILTSAVRGNTQMSMPSSAFRTIRTNQGENSTLSLSSVAYNPNAIIDNVFAINDMFDADRLTEWIPKTLMVERESDYNPSKVVVYGRTIDAYTTLDSIVEFGFSPKDIVFILPPLGEEEATCFNNPDVENAIHSRIDEAGVTVMVDYTLKDFVLRERFSPENNGDRVIVTSSLTFQQVESDDIATVEDVLCLIAFDHKAIASDTFRALNNACLVMDGRLVIDPEFHTNDPAIRAAGALTKYSRKLYADRATHDLFNPREVGHDLAHRLLVHFDPVCGPAPNKPPPAAPLVPLFEWPRVIFAESLPFGFRYLQVEKAGPRVRLDDQLRAYDYGNEMATGSTDNNNFFRIHLNMNETVETITCLTDRNRDISQYLCLYGVHERYLNSLKNRWEGKLINDFFDYFAEPWAVAIFHDRLRDLRDEIRQIFASESKTTAKGSEGFEAKLREYIGSDIQMTRFLRKFIVDNYKNAADKELKKTIETRLLSYLEFNSYHLPMYARPGMV